MESFRTALNAHICFLFTPFKIPASQQTEFNMALSFFDDPNYIMYLVLIAIFILMLIGTIGIGVVDSLDEGTESNS